MTNINSDATRFYIAAGYPWCPVKAGDPVPPNPINFCHSRTREKAIAKARKQSKHTRTDCAVYVHDGQRVIAATGINSGPGGWERELS